MTAVHLVQDKMDSVKKQITKLHDEYKNLEEVRNDLQSFYHEIPDSIVEVDKQADNAFLYLQCARKQFNFEIPDGWTEIAFERFDYTECAVYSKPTSKLNGEDKRLVSIYGHKPTGWIEPCASEEH